MTKRELATMLSERTGLPALLISRVVQAAMDALSESLVKNGRLEWRDLGTFTVKSYPARTIHNPHSGELIPLPARKWVGFKPARKLRSRLGTGTRAKKGAAPARKAAGRKAGAARRSR